MNFLLMLWIVFTLCVVLNNPISAKSKCNNDCLTKTYCLSSSGSSSCSTNNLVSATWSVYQGPSPSDTVGLTLTAENVESSEVRAISLAFKSPVFSSSYTNYTCFKSAIGMSAWVDQNSIARSKKIYGGSSNYYQGVMTCTWSFTVYDNIWPLYYDTPASLMNDNTGILELRSGTKSAVVARNVGDLPTYHFQYLKCCNKVHGDDKYLIVFNQTADNYYFMRPLNVKPKLLTLSMDISSKVQLIFDCNFISSDVRGFVANRTAKTTITDFLHDPYVDSYLNPQCQWSHPLSLTGQFGELNTKDIVFGMKIIADGTVVYTEKGVTFKNSASQLLSFTSILIMIISIILNWSL